MREIDLSKYEIRTDLVMDLVEEDSDFVKKYECNGCKVRKIVLDDCDAKKLGKKAGDYTTLHFDDITDSDNYDNVLSVLVEEFRDILKSTDILDDASCLVVGLGNEKSTADELGVAVARNVTITKHIYDLTGTLEDGYRVTSLLIPGVMGTTGIETSDIIYAVVKETKPDFLVVIDALFSDSVDRLLKTIQITNTGINPGSGVGNKRKELSFDVFGIPVIAIGVPTVVDAVTIVSDTVKFMNKHLSYSIRNKDSLRDKLVPFSKIDYLKDNNYSLSRNEESYFLGAFGNLSNFEKRVLIENVLTPIGYNFIVTVKEIDFIVECLTKLISSSIDIVLHNISTKKF